MTVNIAALGGELADGIDLLKAQSLPVRIKDDGSLPLLLAIRAAARLCWGGSPGRSGR
jgi:hypothetical protein